MKKRFRILCVLFAVVLLVICGAVITTVAISPENQVKNKLKAAGAIDFGEKNNGVELFAVNQSEVAYVGEHIQVYQDDIDRTVKKMMLVYDDESEAQEEALKVIALRNIFCYRAEEEHLLGTEEEFLSWLNDYRATIEGATNYEDFEAYVSGTGMTIDEYWEMMETDPDVRAEYYSNKFAEHLQAEFAASEGISMDDPSFYEQWSEYYIQYKDDALEQENLRPFHESESSISEDSSSEVDDDNSDVTSEFESETSSFEDSSSDANISGEENSDVTSTYESESSALGESAEHMISSDGDENVGSGSVPHE